MSITSEERNLTRATVEAAIVVTITAITEDAAGIAALMGVFDAPMGLVEGTLARAAECAASLRALRDEYEMTLRADARELLAKAE